MRQIEGTLRNIKRYQYDGLTSPPLYRLDRVGAYLYAAELSITTKEEAQQKMYLLQRRLISSAWKENQTISLFIPDNPQHMKTLDFLTGLQYICMTAENIETLLSPTENSVFVSGTMLQVHPAKTRWNMICEKAYWIIILMGIIGAYLALS